MKWAENLALEGVSEGQPCREVSAVPPGLIPLLPNHPALKRWAKFCVPTGLVSSFCVHPGLGLG